MSNEMCWACTVVSKGMGRGRFQWYTFVFTFFFFHWHYSSLWALSCRIMSFHFFLSATDYLHLLTPSTWRSLSSSSFRLFLGFPLLLVPSSSWVKIFLGILSSSILSRWPNQLILCPFVHFTIFVFIYGTLTLLVSGLIWRADASVLKSWS